MPVCFPICNPECSLYPCYFYDLCLLSSMALLRRLQSIERELKEKGYQ